MSPDQRSLSLHQGPHKILIRIAWVVQSYNIKNTCLWIGLEIELDLVETARIKVIQEHLRARKANR